MMKHSAFSEYEKTNMTDHQFAAWLRKRGATENWYSLLNMNCWFVGRNTIALAIYDNANSTRNIYIKKDTG